MKLHDIIFQPRPFAAGEGDKIPWNDPAFSKRMLQNHLSQDHDWASRRASVIEQQVNWISKQLMPGAKILDLGCGPGLYLQRLAANGFHCTGVDFAPASIDFARQQAKEKQRDITYYCEDIRTFVITEPQDLVMMTFGEFNVFCKRDAHALIEKAASALKPGGRLLVEVHTEDEIKHIGSAERTWQPYQTGLFSEAPHVVLIENAWDDQTKTASTAWWVMEESGNTTRYSSQMQAWSNEEYFQLLKSAGIGQSKILTEELWPVGQVFSGKLFALYGEK